jgi:hypothetical protein
MPGVLESVAEEATVSEPAAEEADRQRGRALAASFFEALEIADHEPDE